MMKCAAQLLYTWTFGGSEYVASMREKCRSDGTMEVSGERRCIILDVVKDV